MFSLHDRTILSGTRRALLAVLLVTACAAGGVRADAGDEAGDDAGPSATPTTSSEGVEICSYDEVRVVEHLGEIIPEGIEFKDVQGKKVELRSLMSKPTVLLLVYLRCPNVCSPLMREIAHTVDEVDLDPGVDYNLVTVSFDARETPDLAKRGKANLLATMKKKLSPESWRFLTGDAANIRKLCDSVGFHFKVDKEGDYTHPSPVIFVSKHGKIVRYLGHSLQQTKEDRNRMVPAVLPAQFEMALNDARDGNARSFMQTVQQICYSFDPEGHAYVLNVNRLILFVTLTGVAIFLAILLIKRKKKSTGASAAGAADGSVDQGGHA